MFGVTVRLMSDRELQRLEVLRDLDQKRLTTNAAGRRLDLGGGLESISPGVRPLLAKQDTKVFETILEIASP